MSQCEHPAGKCNNADDCAEHICAQPKQKPTLLWGWHYGKQELRELLDFVYGGPPATDDERVA